MVSMSNRAVCLSALFCLFCAGIVTAGDMALELDNGSTVLLHEDNTWDYLSKQAAKISSDVTVMLDDGTSVTVRTNRTWRYVNKQKQQPGDESTSLGTAYSMGSAKGTDLFDTRMSAMKQATTQLARQLVKAAGCVRCSLEEIIICVEQHDKKIDIQEKPGDNNTWRVEVKMALDTDEIGTILDCASVETE